MNYLGENSEVNCEVVPQMARHLPWSVKRSYGDGAYDTEDVRAAFHALGMESVPPKRGAIVHDSMDKLWMKSRNDASRAITGLGNDYKARKIWKILAGYHQRS